jgi:hypothetical protein
VCTATRVRAAGMNDDGAPAAAAAAAGGVGVMRNPAHAPWSSRLQSLSHVTASVTRQQ